MQDGFGRDKTNFGREVNKIINQKAITRKRHLAKPQNVMSDNTLSIRDSGEYYNTAFYLTDNFNWELKRDSQEKVCLIPTKKNRGCHN